MSQTRTTSALIRNAIEACQAAGFPVGAIEVMQGGGVRILPIGANLSQPTPKEGNSCDNLFKRESD